MKLKHLNRYDIDAEIVKWLDSHPDPNNVIREILDDHCGLTKNFIDWLVYRDTDFWIYSHIRSALIDIIESEDPPNDFFKEFLKRYRSVNIPCSESYTGNISEVIVQATEDDIEGRKK